MSGRAVRDLITAGKVDTIRGLSVQERERWRDLQRGEAQLNQQLVAEGVKTTPDGIRIAALRKELSQAEVKRQGYTDLL